MGFFKVGAVTFPLPAATSNPSLLKTADPALAKVLDFFSFMLTTYIEDALVSFATLSNAPIGAAVAQVAAINPDAIAKAEQWQFPLLCGWRQSNRDNDRTLNWRAAVETIGLAYILPPLSPTQRITLEPVLAAVGKVCNYAFTQGTDPGYNSGESILAANLISRARLMAEQFGAFKFDDSKETYWPSWTGELEIVEQTEPYTPASEVSDLLGIDTIVTQQADDGNVLVATGTAPPVVTMTGTLPLPWRARVEIQTTGPRGIATFRVSLDGGTTWIASGVTTAATYTIPTTSNVLNFPVGTYTNDNVYVSTPVIVVQTKTDF